MKKCIYLLAGFFSMNSLAKSDLDTTNFLEANYLFSPAKDCFLMQETIGIDEDKPGWTCISNVISKDFRQSGDNLYYIVLSSLANGGFTSSPGVIDLYAYTKSNQWIVEKGVELGSYGYPPRDWKFKKLKNGKIELQTESCLTHMGETECTEFTYTVKNNRFVGKVGETKISGPGLFGDPN